MHRVAPLLALLLAAAPAAAQTPPTDLTDYVSKPDASFAWKLVGKKEADAGTTYELSLVSQTWQTHDWDHALLVFVPKATKPQPTMVLWNQGGTPNATSTALGMAIAQKVGAPVAFLYGVPKQPLYDGKKEDALIAETFVRFLETKDASWPLLFPMVKSVVKAMDALQAFAKREWEFDVKTFVVTGASKRGWTSWLTAATGDPRVKAIAPLVIDTLNMPQQMKNQVAAFGKPSEMIRDYVERKLVPIPNTPEAERLWKMVDPWAYRDKITVPKLILNGANDPYWPLDALNSYWDDLKGEKRVTYVPNAGHDLREVGAGGQKELFPMRGVNALSAFCKAQVFDKKMPDMTWKFVPKGDGVVAEVACDGALKGQRVCVADSPTRDFRKARWKEEAIPSGGGGGASAYALGAPTTGFRAVFVETEFDLDGVPFPLSSGIHILEAKK